MNDKYDIFISYSRKDTATVNAVMRKLEQSGFSVWIDKDGIESGDAFKHVIVKAIDASTVVLFFSSINSNASPWTAKEIGIANSKKKYLIPIKLDGAEYNEEILFDLVNLDYVDLTSGVLDEAKYEKLVRTLSKKCGKPITSRPTSQLISSKPVENRYVRSAVPTKPISQSPSAPKHQRPIVSQNHPIQRNPSSSQPEPTQTYRAKPKPVAKQKSKFNAVFERKGCMISIAFALLLIMGFPVLWKTQFANKGNDISTSNAETIQVADVPTSNVEIRKVTNMDYEVPSLGRCKYTGTVLGVIPDGEGIAEWSSGIALRYEGDWTRGKMDGFGTYMNRYGDIFVGQFRDNEYEKGKLTISDTGEYFVGTFKGGEPYKGDWYNSKGKILERL